MTAQSEPTVIRDEVVETLQAEEPDYDAAARRFGADAGQILADLAVADDLELASKATYLAGLMDADTARKVLVPALRHPDPVVRVAAAGTLENQPELFGQMAAQLLADPDAGVRKSALRSLRTVGPPTTELKEQVQLLATADPVPALRELAREVSDQPR
jgi:HEAT repeat protein